MSAEIKLHSINPTQYSRLFLELPPDGNYVLHSDHLASHVLDEAAERAAFEAEYAVGPSAVRYDTNTRQYVTDWPGRETLDLAWRANILLEGWLACAKSRAKRFGMSENGDS